MIVLNNNNNKLVIATNRNIEQKYDFYLTNDISQKEVTTTLFPTTYNSRYMEFELNLSILETGFGKIIIKDNDTEIYNDIYLYEWEEEDKYTYTKDRKKFVYKRK